MWESLARYIDWVELETFFSGYLLVFSIFYLLSRNGRFENYVHSKILPRLPIAYAFVGVLYVGLLIKDSSPGFDLELVFSAGYPFFKILGILAILFWIPLIRKNP